jgi:predicted metal-binding protein
MDNMEKLEKLRQSAEELGADRAIVIPTSDLVIRTAARAKCFIPACKFYGSSIMCPPHNPLTPDVTSRIVSEFRYGILLQLDAEVDDFVGDQWRKKHVPIEIKHKEIVAKLESRAFYMGFHLSMGFAAGECSLCLPHSPCSVLKGFDCSHPLQARPAMEACGFDVFTISRRVGWKIVPIGHESRRDTVPCASLIGLVLVV